MSMVRVCSSWGDTVPVPDRIIVDVQSGFGGFRPDLDPGGQGEDL